MMRLLLALAVLAFAGPAAAASFDCKKASSRVEKVICADPELSRLDERLAEIYAEALKLWGGKLAAYVRLTQKGWLGDRTLLPAGYGQGGVYCEDDKTRLACLRGLYRDRIAVLTSPAFPLSGVYSRGQDFFRILARPGGLNLSFATAAGLQGFMAEEAVVAVKPGADRAVFVLQGEGKEACRIEGSFTAETMTVVQQGPCAGVRLNGSWTRDQKRDPEGEQF